MPEYIQVSTTTGTEAEAEAISRSVIEGRLAACGQVSGPIHSIYWWEGKLENSREWLCLFKTEEKNFREIERLIKEKHSYEVPEIIAVPVTEGGSEYLSWISKEIG